MTGEAMGAGSGGDGWAAAGAPGGFPGSVWRCIRWAHAAPDHNPAETGA